MNLIPLLIIAAFVAAFSIFMYRNKAPGIIIETFAGRQTLGSKVTRKGRTYKVSRRVLSKTDKYVYALELN